MKRKGFSTQTIVFGAFLVTIAFLLGGGFQRVTGIPTSIKLNFGGASQSIGFTAVPLVIASLVLGPFGGLIVAALYDTLQYLLITGGVWNPIFTLSEIVVGWLPGMIYLGFKKVNLTRSIRRELVAFLVAYGLAMILMTSVMGQGQSEAQRVVQMISFENGFHIVNGILLGAFLLAIVLSIGLMFFFSRKRSTEGLFSFDKIYLVTFLAMILRSLISGYGLWLYMGKTVPLIFYWLPRFVTPMFLVPIVSFAITGLGYILKRYTHD
ncbi:MAG TPA: ECF transporter S component [Candidatus Fimiplasma intestinipullorum]|uniref:ECF transporter S component n=1 Tax=Candidatus Fimiplasma intestinipullorum TaxID=2840825 RepID=A0A9D1HPE5_9FIRM|nr:ECF transporter S component [Candidatus Fimiplasma intestinipullorum]